MNDDDFELEDWRNFPELNTESLWIFNQKEGLAETLSDYHGSFVPQIPEQLIRRFTRKGDLVIDPMCGAGTTLAVAKKLGRDAIGVDINSEIVNQVNNYIGKTNRKRTEKKSHISAVVNDSRKQSALNEVKSTLKLWGHESAALLLMHPPYFNIVKFTNNPAELSQSKSMLEFNDGLVQIFDLWIPTVHKGGIVAVVIGDIYLNSQWFPLAFKVLQLLQNEKYELNLRGIVVKNMSNTRGKKNSYNLWRYRSLRNQTFLFSHEYILILRREK